VSFFTLLERCDASVQTILGEDVTYAPSVGEVVTVGGVFDAAYVRVDAGEAGVSSSGPAVFLRLSELPSDPMTDTPVLTIRGVEYELREVEPDGMGGVLLLLHKV